VKPPFRDCRFLATIVVLFAVLWTVTAWYSYRYWVHGADHRDFYPLWAGTRWLISGSPDVYSPRATHFIQVTLYGAALPPERDQQGFAYPAHLALLLAPFALISDVEIATAVWQGFTLVVLLGCLLLLRTAVNPSIPLYVPAALVFWHYPLLMLFQGQVTVLAVLAISGAVVFYQRRQDGIAGLLLAAGTVKPELALAPLITLVIHAFFSKRFSLLIGLFASGAGLFLGSLMLAGWWVPGWLIRLEEYTGYSKIFWTAATLWQIHPLLLAGLLVYAGASLWLTRKDAPGLIGAATAVGMLLLPQTLNWGLTLLTVPLLIAWKQHARFVVLSAWAAGWLALFIAPLPDWWKIQSAGLPVLALTAVLLSRLPLGKQNHPL